MEELLNVDTGDGHIIYGTLNSPQEDTDLLIVFVHGITGSRKEHQFYDAARYFPAKGYATYRFNLYSRDPGGRVLSDIDIRTQSRDLDTVVRHFIGKYGKIYLVGHSLGGPTVMGADLGPVRALVLWDPSITPDTAPGKTFYSYDEHLKKYVIRWQLEYLVTAAMIEQWKAAGSLVRNLIKPTRIVFAGSYAIRDTWKSKLSEIPAVHDSITIEGAGHSFDEEGTQDKLYEATLDWLARY
jgi:pimeloyl-ACP methyl ester carboxylesterase